MGGAEIEGVAGVAEAGGVATTRDRVRLRVNLSLLASPLIQRSEFMYTINTVGVECIFYLYIIVYHSHFVFLSLFFVSDSRPTRCTVCFRMHLISTCPRTETLANRRGVF